MDASAKVQEQVLTAKEVANTLRVNLYTVHELLREGKLHGFKLMSHWRITQGELDRFMKVEVKDAGQVGLGTDQREPVGER